MTSLVRTAGAVVSAVLSVATLAGCGAAADLAGLEAADTSPPTQAAQSPAVRFQPSAEDFDALRRLLETRAAAALAGDRKAFLATVDATDDDFYEAQSDVFDNLQDLRVGSMRYELEDYGMETADLPGDDPTLSPPVMEHVRIGGTDRLPTGATIDFTFVRRDGTWLVGAMDGVNPKIAPWAGDAIDVVRTRHLVVIVDDEDRSTGLEVADQVEAALVAAGRTLQVDVGGRLAVDATEAGVREEFGNGGDGVETAAITYPVFAGEDLREAGVSGWRIKVNPKYVDRLARDATLWRHEITHYVLRHYLGVNPIWLSEGIAEYVGYAPGTLEDFAVDDDLYEQLTTAKPELPLSGLFHDSPELNYLVGWAAVTYIVETQGMARVKALMRAYADSGRLPYGDFANREVLPKVLGMSEAELAAAAYETARRVQHR